MGWLDLLKPFGDIIDKLIPDKAAAAAAKAQLQQLSLQGELQQELAQLTAVTTAQSDINKVEAANASVFVSGGRPFIMWVCGAAFAYVALLEPITRFIAQVGFKYAGAFPVIDTNLTMQVLLGLLGLGAMRSFDKVKGVVTGNPNH